MKAGYIPPALTGVVERLFAQQSVHGQLATLGLDGKPALRTVHFRLLNTPPTIAFNTNTGSDKFAQLKRCSAIEGCFFDHQQDVQLRWRGSVGWIDDKDQQHQGMRRHMWGLMREGLRRGYWIDALGEDYRQVAAQTVASDIDLSQPTPSFVTVICFPDCWDCYERGGDDVFAARRHRYQRQTSAWQCQALSVFSSQPL